MSDVKVLLFGGGGAHDYAGICPVLEGYMSVEPAFSVDYVIEDYDVLLKDRVADYGLIVIYHTGGSLTAEQCSGLTGHVAGGCGLVGVHSAADSFLDAPDYVAMLGGRFIGHPCVRQFLVSLNDAVPGIVSHITHPVTRDIKGYTVEDWEESPIFEYSVTDEQYCLDYDPRVDVIVSTLFKGESHPVAWTKAWGEGRVNPSPPWRSGDDGAESHFLSVTKGVGRPTFLPVDYVQALRRWADEHHALLIFDEIQAGMGRTGKFYCYEHYGVQADLVCCGKGITSSLPLSAVLGPAALLDIPGPGDFTSTHSGNPLCCAAALATLEVIERENLVAEAERKGGIFAAKLAAVRERFPQRVGKISGRGMCWSIYFVKQGTSEPDIELGSQLTDRMIEKGVMLYLTHSDMVKMTPPLTIPDDALEEGLDVLAEVVEEADVAGC